MRFANVSGRACLVLDGRAVDIAEASGGDLSSDPMATADLANHQSLRALAAGADPSAWPELDEATLGPPVPRPGKIIAMALNYRSHAEEAGKAIPTEPHVMAKFPTCICGPYDDVPIGDLQMVDYEVELVVAVGRRCKGVAGRPASISWTSATTSAGWWWTYAVPAGGAPRHHPPGLRLAAARHVRALGPESPPLGVPPARRRDRRGGHRPGEGVAAARSLAGRW